MEKCDNCGALVEKCGTASDGKKYCCIHCVFNHLGCRCQYGELGIAETEDWAALNGCFDDADDDDDNDHRWHYIDDDETDFEPCERCDGHDACRDFGCAYTLGLGGLVKNDDVI